MVLPEYAHNHKAAGHAPILATLLSTKSPLGVGKYFDSLWNWKIRKQMFKEQCN